MANSKESGPKRDDSGNQKDGDQKDIDLVVAGLDGDKEALLEFMYDGGKAGIIVEQDGEETIADLGTKTKRVH